VSDSVSQDARRLVKTATPGIYKRGARYVVVGRDPRGRQVKKFARTLAEARVKKAELRADVARGEYRTTARVSFADYAARWIATYDGRTARGIRIGTLRAYRRDLGLDEEGSRPDPLVRSRTSVGSHSPRLRRSMSRRTPRNVLRLGSPATRFG